MKTSLVRFAIAASATALTACGTMNPHHSTHAQQDKPPGPNRYLQDASAPQQPGIENPDPLAPQPPVTDTTAVPAPPKTDTTAGAPTGTTTPPPPPPPTSQYPYGKPVPGKKGFVNSPYDEKAGMIDVRDYAPGTKVRDPYTNKIFLVP